MPESPSIATSASVITVLIVRSCVFVYVLNSSISSPSSVRAGISDPPFRDSTARPRMPFLVAPMVISRSSVPSTAPICSIRALTRPVIRETLLPSVSELNEISTKPFRVTISKSVIEPDIRATK